MGMNNWAMEVDNSVADQPPHKAYVETHPGISSLHPWNKYHLMMRRSPTPAGAAIPGCQLTSWFGVTKKGKSHQELVMEQCFTHTGKRQSEISLYNEPGSPVASRSCPTANTV
nr:PREDICTED: uncharacterized protein LOC103543843 [Equus przewalskii]